MVESVIAKAVAETQALLKPKVTIYPPTHLPT